MQNSFEKQVQEKMDELQFVPTEPVWQHIEKQIRTKKDRRRYVLWLPLLFLLLGGGVWWLATQDPNKNSVVATNAGKTKKTNTDKTKNTQEEQAGVTDFKDQINAPGQDKEPEVNGPLEKQNNTVASENIQKKNLPVKEQVSLSAVAVEKTQKQKPASPSAVEHFASSEKPSGNSEGKTVLKNEGMQGNASTNKSAATTPPANKIDSSLNKRSAAKDSALNYKVAGAGTDTANAVIAEVSKKQISKGQTWQWGVIANAGISGQAKKFGSFSEDKAMQDVYAAPGNGQPNNGIPPPSANPSPVTNNWAFSVGVMAKKKVANRLALSTGLQYHYYSSNIAVGKKTQDSLTGQLSRSLSQYYLNSGANFKNYHNQYHFIGLPVAIDWQMLKKFPLHLHAGLSLQQLISTNALLFNKTSNIYYSDKNGFNKTQLFSDLGVSYSISNKGKTSLLLGPQLQYGITNLEKNTSGKHLFSLGLTARLLFNKN
jgi:hypothetical protein